MLVCDGAMGTMLHAGGVSLDRSLPELNLARPELVRAIHHAYVDAGVHILQTNTFGASRHRLARHGSEERVAEINRAGVRLAQEVREATGAPVLVAGSVGPPSPSGQRARLADGDARAALREQIEALVTAGVDLLILETFGDLQEMVAAVETAQAAAEARLGAPLPIVAQMTFDDDCRTLAGDEAADVAMTLDDLGVSVVGANCTLGPQGLLEVLRQLARHTLLPLAAQPNAGLPSLVDGRLRFTVDGDYLARYARRFVELGAAVVGGCCGTTPDHLEAVVRAVADLPPPARRVGRAAPRGATHRAPGAAPAAEGAAPLRDRLGEGRFLVACELRPGVGGDADRALRDAALLREAGAEAVMVAPARRGRAQMNPVSLALLLQQRQQLPTILAMNAWDRSAQSLQSDLLGAHALGLRNVLCWSGTPPVQGEYPPTTALWDIDSIRLLQLLRGLNDGRDCNNLPIGKPTAFCVGASVNPTAEDRARELQRAQRKLAERIDFLVVRPAYDAAALLALLDALDLGSLPVLLTVMPLQSFQHAEYLQHEVPGVTLPESTLERMWQAGERAPEVGLDLAEELVATVRGRIAGVIVAPASGASSETAQCLRRLCG